MSNTKLFEPDTPTIDPITEGVRSLRQQHKANAEAHHLAFETRAESEWLRAEQQRKDSFINKYREDNYERLRYPYPDHSPAAQYRVSLPKDSRIESLAAVKEYGEMLYCCLARTPRRKVTLDCVQEWFAPYIPVTGDTSITEDVGRGGVRNTLTHATGLSEALGRILTNTWLVDVQFGQVTWNPGEDIEPSEY